MPRYYVMIDGIASSQSFSLDELLNEGYLDDYDENIKIRSIDDSRWYVAREYPFHTSPAPKGYYIDQCGQIVRTEAPPRAPKGYYINQCGEIVRTEAQPRLELSTDSLHFSSSSGSLSIKVTTNGEWNISRMAAPWVHLSQSESVLIVRVDQNYISDSRTDYIKLKSGNLEKRVDISQLGSPPTTPPSHTPSSSSGCGCFAWIVIAIIIIIIMLSKNS